MSLTKFIPIILPHEPIGGGIGGPSVPLLGHGAFIIVDSTGKASFMNMAILHLVLTL